MGFRKWKISFSISYNEYLLINVPKKPKKKIHITGTNTLKKPNEIVDFSIKK